MSDGTVKISTSLDTSWVEKDLKKVENNIQNSGKKIQSTMDNVEKSMKKASSAFNGKQITKELDNVGKHIENTNNRIDLQKKKLSELKEKYESATNPTKQNKIEEQMIKAEAKRLGYAPKEAAE